ncbi:MAG: serine hydrolase [Candidatus Bathyarchaeota archaeon]|nr:serine hydrolase [Candidatus Bathyarchaeota archaeon]
MVSEILSCLDLSSGVGMFTAWIEAQMAYRGQPGLSIAVVSDQKMVWSKGFGYADVEKRVEATPKTRYRIASITKLFTATSIMQLRDRGMLSLDDEVATHLPWFKLKGGYPEAPPIRIWHLLTHTSGLPREAPTPYWTDSNFPTREEVMRLLSTQVAAAPTETLWKYSNLALTVAGEIVQEVSGTPYAEYVEEYILKPLGMKNTLVLPPAPDDPMLAKGYGRRLPDGSRGVSPYTDCKGITPAANMTTTAEDLAKFAMLQFRDGPEGGKQILRGSTLREMHRPHWLQPDWREGFGVGFKLSRIGGKTFVGHGGAVQGFRTHIRTSPDDKVGVVVLTNSDDGQPISYAEKALQWLTYPLTMGKTGAEAENPYAVYEGRFRDAWSDMQTLTLNNGLYAIDPSQPDPALTLIKLEPNGEHTFKMYPEEGSGSHGENMVWEFDKRRVVRVKRGENYTYPVKKW